MSADNPNDTPPLLYLGQDGDETSPRTLVRIVFYTPHDYDEIDHVAYEAIQPQGTVSDGKGYERDVIGFAEFPRNQPVGRMQDFDAFQSSVNAKSVYVHWKPRGEGE